MHAGITPAYRGVHGGYWALAEGRTDLVGTTIHLVDEGIDTGGVIEQASFSPTEADTFVTYPYLHTAAGLPPLIEAVRGILRGHAACAPRALESDHAPTPLPPHALGLPKGRPSPQRVVVSIIVYRPPSTP